MKRVITGIIIFIAIIVIAFIIYVLVGKGKNIISAVNEQDINTELLQIQTKIKKIKVDSEMQKDAVLKGQKFSDSTEEYVQKLKDEGKISETDENYKDYYIWDQDVLDELNLNIKLKNGEIFIVNYTTEKVIEVTTSDINALHSTDDIML